MIERGRKREGEDEGNRQEEESKEEVMTTGLIKVNLEVRQSEVIISSAGEEVAYARLTVLSLPTQSWNSTLLPITWQN